MIDKNNIDNALFHELTSEEYENYFSFRRDSFMHNIDTFYYSVKFKNDFRLKTNDINVLKLRKYFKLK